MHILSRNGSGVSLSVGDTDMKFPRIMIESGVTKKDIEVSRWLGITLNLADDDSRHSATNTARAHHQHAKRCSRSAKRPGPDDGVTCERSGVDCAPASIGGGWRASHGGARGVAAMSRPVKLHTRSRFAQTRLAVNQQRVDITRFYRFFDKTIELPQVLNRKTRKALAKRMKKEGKP